jgi:hypothetical protein
VSPDGRFGSARRLTASVSDCGRWRARLAAAGLTAGFVLLTALGSALLAAPESSATPALSDFAATKFPGGRNFFIRCGFSHRNNDDPIVFPGEPGRSHDHTYLGNRSVDARSTPTSLRGGPTTCHAKADAAAYWVPTLFAGQRPIVPLAGLAYYVRRTLGYLRPFPPDLKMVAGNANARRAQPKSVVSWSCGGISATRRFSAIPACPHDQLLQFRVEFPNCWNGTSMDSADHKRHMAYSAKGRCPASHPVAMPALALVLLYEPVPRGARLSSGRFGGHADFMNGWDPDVLLAYVQGI